MAGIHCPQRHLSFGYPEVLRGTRDKKAMFLAASAIAKNLNVPPQEFWNTNEAFFRKVHGIPDLFGERLERV